MREVCVPLLLTPGLNVSMWGEQHAAGLAPDMWPYGLNRLNGPLITVDAQPIGPTRGFINRVVRRLFGGYNWLQAVPSRSGSPTVALAWDEYSGIPALLRPGRPPTVTGCIWLTDRDDMRPLEQWIVRRALKRAAKVIVLSDAQIPVLRDRFGVAEGAITHVTFGVDTDFFTPGDSLKETRGLVLTAGRDRHRDYATLISATQTLREQDTELELRCAARGAGVTGVPDEALVRPKNHAEMRDLYQTAEIVVVPLRDNLHGSGMTVALEAMSCGKPVVVSGTPGMEHYIEHGVTGMLVPAGDPHAMAQAISTLQRDDALRRRIGAAARSRVVERYSTVLMAQQISAVVLGSLR